MTTEVVEISSGANALSDIAGGVGSISGGVRSVVAVGSAVGEAWWASGDTVMVADGALEGGIGICSI